MVERILHNRECGLALKAQAVLFRASHHSGPLEIELSAAQHSVRQVRRPAFLEASHIKDVLAFLRFCENVRDRVAGFRALQLLPGVGPATAARALDAVADRADPVSALASLTPPAAAQSRLAGLRRNVPAVRGAPPAGRPNSISFAVGTSRICSASTKTPQCAKPT